MDKVVFTAIFGNYEELKDPTVVTPGWRYVCFTDQPLTSSVWEIERRACLPEGPQRTARYYKLMFHEVINSEFSMWVDASFQINCDLNEWWKLFKPPFTAPKHPIRQDVYLEASACMKNKRGSHEELMRVRKQSLKYARLFMPRSNGIISSGILMRQRNNEVIEFCEAWYEELKKESVRDQLSFAFVAWKNPVHHVFEWDYRKATEFIWTTHYHRRKQEA